MSDQRHATPLMTFNFEVAITLEGSQRELCHGAFAECDGLEITMQPRAYQEGGDNTRRVQLFTPVAYGRLTLRRGMTSGGFDLWEWFDAVAEPGGHGLRADCVVSIRSADGRDDRAQFHLERCLPVRLRAPALNARDGLVAIEEMQVAYERLRLVRPGGGSSATPAPGRG